MGGSQVIELQEPRNQQRRKSPEDRVSGIVRKSDAGEPDWRRKGFDHKARPDHTDTNCEPSQRIKRCQKLRSYLYQSIQRVSSNGQYGTAYQQHPSRPEPVSQPTNQDAANG